MAEPQAPAPPPPIDPNSEVKAYSPTGEKITILARDAAQLEAAGGSIATNRDIQQEKLDAVPLAAKAAHLAMGDAGFWIQGGQFTPEGETFTRNVASGATMGLSDLATKGVGSAVGGPQLATQYRDTANAFDAESPMAAKLGEGVGMVAGSVAGGAVGGAGLAGRATLALPSAGISALGGAAENAVARATAGMLARGALGRAGSTALQWAARGAVEGALMEGMHQTTDDLFNDHELAADKILIAAGKGGLYGAGTGFVMGGLGSLAKSGAQGGLAALRGTAASVAERTEGALAKLEGAAAKLESQADDGVNVARKNFNAAASNAGALERVERGTGEVATATERKASAGFLEKQANEQALRALGGTRVDMRKTVAALGEEGAQDVGALLIKKNIISAGDNAESILPKILTNKESVGEAIGKVVQGADSRVPFVDVLQRAKKLEGDLLKQGPQFVGAADSIGDAMTKLTRSLDAGGHVGADGTVAVSELLKARRGLEGIAYTAGKFGDSNAKQAISHVARDIEDQIMAHLEKASPGARAIYEPLKREYQLLSHAQRIAETGVERLGGNRMISLTDTIAGTVGMAAGGPLGLLAGVGNKMLRERGNATAAVLLSRMAQRNAAEAALHTFDDVATRAASGMMKAAGKAEAAEGLAARNAARQAERGYGTGARKAATDGVQSRARAGMAEVKRLQDPATMQAHIDQKLGTLRQTAPRLASAMAFRMQQTAQFLASKMPEETKSYAPISAPSRKPSVNPVQAARFLRYQEVAEDPQSAFVRFSRGEVRREDVEFMRECTPKAFETLQVRVLQRLTDAQEKGVVIPHDQRVKLSILLDIKGDATLEPGLFRVLQKNASSPPSGQGGAGPQHAPKRPVQLSSTQLTGMDKLEQ